jgi:YD repeat-containing protein
MEISKSRVNKSYQYDEMDRLVSVTFENGRQIVYNYDAAGNRVSTFPFSVQEKPISEPVLMGKMPLPPPVYPVPQPALQTTCPNCHAAVDPGARFCPQCAAPLTTQVQPSPPTPIKKFCPKCGKARQGSRQFCASCGYDFNS